MRYGRSPRKESAALKNSRLRSRENAAKHFTKRAHLYDSSSQWVSDPKLIRKIRDLAGAGPEARVLDIGIGTGKIAQAFRGHVKCVIGVDVCLEMAKQATRRADKIVLTPAEKLPFKNNTFDVCVCRQGLQFMKLKDVLLEMRRVLKPGGSIVLCHLTAHNRKDKKESFLIQKLRNPARKNFFLPEYFVKLLKEASFTGIELFEYITTESVNQWITKAAIDEDAKNKIRELYINASDDFKRIHNIRFTGADIFDTMKMVIVRAKKKGN